MERRVIRRSRAASEAIGTLSRPSEPGSTPRLGDALSRSLRGDIGPDEALHREPVAWPSKRARRLPGLAATLTFVLGGLALAGTLWGTGGVLQLLQADRPAPPLAAVGLMLCSLAVVLLMIGPRWIAKSVALLCALIGLAILVPGLPLASALTLPFANAVSAWGDPVAIAVGPCFILFAIAAFMITDHKSGRRLLAVISGTAGLAVTLLSFLGHILLSGRRPGEVDATLIMPFQTAFSLAAVFCALLLVRPKASWVGILLSNDSRARIARILLVIALTPLPLGWLADRGHRIGLYGADVRFLLVVLGAVLLLTLLALAAAVMIGDEQRNRLEVARALDLSPILLQDFDGRIVYWSKGCETLYGWKAHEAEGRFCADVLGQCAPDFGRLDTLLLENDAWQGELRHRTRDGRELWVSARWVLYRQGEATPPITLVSFTDVTKERQVQEALLERDSRLLQLQSELIEVSRLSSMGEMAAALAHELNQPLTAAANFLGAAEMVLSHPEPPPATRKHVADAVSRAKEEALRAGEIVRRLREFISRGEADMQRESLPDIINNAVLLGLANVEHKAIDLECSLSPEAEYVLADRVQIQQVIVNIVRNAAEAMMQQAAGPRRITISTRARPQKCAEIIIRDTGPGISEEVAATLFTPFSSSKATGMGVGLSICKRIVETHGGEIWIGQAPGGGAEFHFTLPLFHRAEDAP